MANNTDLNVTDITSKWSLFLDVVAAAVMCDRTRVITIGVHKALGPGPDSADATLVGHYHSEDASGGTWHGLAHDWSNANSRRMLKGINAWVASEVFAKLLASWTSPRWAAAPTSTTRSSTGATSSASTTSGTASRACWPAARAASSSPGATSTTSTGTGAPTSHRRTATSSRGSRTTSSW